MEKFLFISGVVSLIIGVTIFLFVFKVLKPLLKTQDSREQYDFWLLKHTKKAKGFAFLLSFFGIITVIQNNPDKSVSFAPVTKGRAWTDTDKESLTTECVQLYVSQEQLSAGDEDLAQDYCQCTTEKMTEEFSINDLLSHDSLSQMEKVQLYEPVVKNCLNDLEYQLNERYRQGITK